MAVERVLSVSIDKSMHIQCSLSSLKRNLTPTMISDHTKTLTCAFHCPPSELGIQSVFGYSSEYFGGPSPPCSVSSSLKATELEGFL